MPQQSLEADYEDPQISAEVSGTSSKSAKHHSVRFREQLLRELIRAQLGQPGKNSVCPTLVHIRPFTPPWQWWSSVGHAPCLAVVSNR